MLYNEITNVLPTYCTDSYNTFIRILTTLTIVFLTSSTVLMVPRERVVLIRAQPAAIKRALDTNVYCLRIATNL